MIVSLRPQVVFAMAYLPPLCKQLCGEFMFGCADLVKQFVERFGRELLARPKRPKDIDQQEPNANNFGQAMRR